MLEQPQSDEELQPLVAGIGRKLMRAFKRGLKGIFSGGNSSEARSARASAQPRDRKGRWVATGASLRANISVPDGKGGRKNVNVTNLKAIGSTPDGKKIRALITNDDYLGDHESLKEGNVIEISPKNAELLTARLDREFLKKKGIDPDLQHDLPKTLEELPDNVEDLNAKEADELDIQLALGGLTDDEDKDRRAERDAEPLAKLPPALAEKAVEGEDVKKLVEDAERSSKAPEAPEAPKAEEQKAAPDRDYSSDDYAPLKPITPAWLSDPKNNGKQIFYVRNGKARRAWVSSDDNYLYKGYAPADPTEGGEGLGDIDDFLQAQKQGLLEMYQGQIPRHKDDGKELEGWEVNRVRAAQNEKKKQARDAKKAEKAKEEPKAEEPEAEEPAEKPTPEPKAPEVAPEADRAGKDKSKEDTPDDVDLLDDEDFEDVEEEEDTPTPTPEPVEPPKKEEKKEEEDPRVAETQKRIDDLRKLAEDDPEKREVLDNIAEARKALNRNKIDEANEWLDEAEAVNAEIDKAKASKKKSEELKKNVPEVKPEPKGVDRTIGGKEDGELAKEMGEPGTPQRDYFWETVDRLTKDPKAEVSGIAQSRIAQAYESEFLKDLGISESELLADFEDLVDGTKTRAEVMSSLKEKYGSKIQGMIDSIPRTRLPRRGNREALKTALEFQIEDKIETALDNNLESLGGLKPAGKEFTKEELDNMTRVERINAMQGLAPIESDVEKTLEEDIDSLNTVEDFAGDFGTKPNGDQIIPSREQKNVVSAVLSNARRIVINALAGSGKTTTLVGAANALRKKDKNARIFVWQFGRDNREQAQSRFDSNSTIVHTFDSAGYNYGSSTLAKNFQNAKAKPHLYNISDEDVAGELRIEGDMPSKVGENVTPAEQARVARKIVDQFSYSADTEITDRHLVDLEDKFTPEQRAKLLSYARRFWRISTAETSFPRYSKSREGRRRGGYTGPGSIPPTNNILTKKWALSNPDLSKLKHDDGSPITHVFVDEAQDINPVISNLLENQGDKVQITTVGDSNQAIYGFRGAIDGLARMTQKSEVELKLTQTRRFGKGLLDLPNAALNILGYDSRIDSELDGGEYVDDPDDIEIDGSKGTTALIVRNNYNGVSAILGMLDRGKKVAVPRAFKDELMDAVKAMEWLDADPETRGSRPKNFPEDFANIYNMRGLAAHARNKDNARSRATFWYRILSGDVFDNKVEKLKKFSEDVKVFGEGKRGSDFSGADGATGTLATTEQGDLTYRIEGNKILLDGKGMGAKGQNSNKNFRYIAFGGQKMNDIRRGENPNWEQYLPGGKRKSDQSATWQIKMNKDGKWETFYEMPGEADRKEYLENLASIFAEDENPDIVITTAHRSKGLEFDNVIIGEDFPGLDTEDKDEKQSGSGIPSIDEMNLAFVAVTRAQKRLSPGSLAWLREYEGEDGLQRANAELGGRNAPNPYEKRESLGSKNYNYTDLIADDSTGAPLRDNEDEKMSLEEELNREPIQAFEVSPDSFEGNIGSYFEDPDAEGVYVKLTDIVRSEDEDGEPVFEMYGKYADGTDFEGVYGLDRTIKEVIFAPSKPDTPKKEDKVEPEVPTPKKAISKTKASDIIEGSTLYDDEENELGEVISKKRQVSKKTGKEVIAVTYRDKDGNEQLKRFFSDSEVNVDQKGLERKTTPPKKKDPAKPGNTVAPTDTDTPEVAEAKKDFAEYMRLDSEWAKKGLDPEIKKARNAHLRKMGEKYEDIKAELAYADEFLRLLPQLENLKPELKGSDYEKKLRERLLSLKEAGTGHRRNFVEGLDKGKLNTKEVKLRQDLFGDIPEPADTPVEKLNDTELPTIFGSSWSVNRDGTFSKVMDGVRWNIRENRDGTISVRNRTHGGETKKFDSWDDAKEAFPDLLSDGRQKNRDALKNFIEPYDTDGTISELIDSGASAEEINNALKNNEDFMDALGRREILPISYMSRLDRIGDGDSNIESSDPLDDPEITIKENPEIPEGYVKTPAGILPEEFADREDDGSEFDAPEDMAAIRDLKPSGRQEELEELFRSFPDAKYAPDGSIVLYRRTKKDLHGEKRGQEFTTEIRVQSDPRQNRWNILVNVTGPDGETQNFVHYSAKRNSWASLIGKADETSEGNGISDLLDKYFNKDEGFYLRKGKRLGWDDNKILKQARIWGGVNGALKRLRTADPDSKLQSILDSNGKGQDLSLRTLEEHAAITLNGIAEELSTDRNWHRKRFSGVSSFWDAVDKKDYDSAAILFNNLALSVPNNKEAREKILSVVSDGIDARYPGLNKKQKSDLMSRVSDRLAEGVTPENVDPKSVPFVDKNGVTLKTGDHVQWESNVYGKATGRIVRFLPFDGTKDGQFNYTDYVMVKFDGKKKPERLAASNMKKVDKESNPVTQYSHWLRNDDLKIARAKQAGYDYDPDRHAIVDSDGDIVELLGDDDTPRDFNDDDGGGDGGDTPEDGGDGGDGGETPEDGGEPPAPTTEASDSTEEELDVSNLSVDTIQPGAFSDTTKVVKRNNPKRINIGESPGRGHKRETDPLRAARMRLAWENSKTPEELVPGYIENNSEGTKKLDPRKHSKLRRLLRLDKDTDLVVVTPTPEAKKAKDVVRGKGAELYTASKADKRRKKVDDAKKKYEDILNRDTDNDPEYQKVRDELRELEEKRSSILDEAYSMSTQIGQDREALTANFPEEISGSVNRWVLNDEQISKLKEYGAKLESIDPGDPTETKQTIDLSRGVSNGPALKKYLTDDTDLSPEEVETIYNAYVGTTRDRVSGDTVNHHLPTFPELAHMATLPESERSQVMEKIFKAAVTSKEKFNERAELYKQLEDLEEKRRVLGNKIRQAEGIEKAYADYVKERADYHREFLRDNGVQIGNRTRKDFGSTLAIIPDEGSQWNQTPEELKTAFDEALSYMPDAAVDNLIKYLKDNGVTLNFGAIRKSNGVRDDRGGFQGAKAYKEKVVEINTGSNDGFNSFKSRHTDTSLHELWHFVQFTNPNLNAIENTYLHDRVMNADGTDVKDGVNFDTIPAYTNEMEISALGEFSENYIAKMYNRVALNGIFNPRDKSTELSTVLMQGLFTDPRYSGQGLGRYVAVKNSKGAWELFLDERDRKAKDQVKRVTGAWGTAYFNPEDGKYYKDSAFSIPMSDSADPDSVRYGGRAPGDLSDEEELMALAMGIMHAFDGETNG